MHTYPNSGTPAGWSTLPPIRTSLAGTESESQPAQNPRTPLPSSPVRRLTRALPPSRRIQISRTQGIRSHIPSIPIQRLIGAPGPINPFHRPRSVLLSTRTPIRKPQRETSRSQAKVVSRIMAISSLLNPTIDHEIEKHDFSELEPERSTRSSREERHPLQQILPVSTSGEILDVEMSLVDSPEPELETSTRSSSEERHPLPQAPSSSKPAETFESDAAVEPEVCRLCKEQFASKVILMRH